MIIYRQHVYLQTDENLNSSRLLSSTVQINNCGSYVIKHAFARIKISRSFMELITSIIGTIVHRQIMIMEMEKKNPSCFLNYFKIASPQWQTTLHKFNFDAIYFFTFLNISFFDSTWKKSIHHIDAQLTLHYHMCWKLRRVLRCHMTC